MQLTNETTCLEKQSSQTSNRDATQSGSKLPGIMMKHVLGTVLKGRISVARKLAFLQHYETEYHVCIQTFNG